jgi:hypothetical protein
MKYIIGESRVNQLSLKYLDMTYGDIKPTYFENTSKGYVQFLDKLGNICMEGIIGQELIIDKKMAESISSMFSLNEFQFIALIKYWTKKRFDMSWGDNIGVDTIE